LLLERRTIVSNLAVPFWGAAFAAHPGVGACITIEDCPCVSSLEHVYSEVIADKVDGLRLVFEFAENISFDACTLEKLFFREEVAGVTVTRCKIPWRDEKARSGGSFCRWLEGTRDLLDLGPVIHREVVPRAVELFLGIREPSLDEGDEGEFGNDICEGP
jgi:hypothetical protein